MLYLQEFPNFLSTSQCNDIISNYGNKLIRSSVARGKNISVDLSFRNSYSLKLQTDSDSDIVIDTIRDKIASFCHLPVSHLERFEIIRYRQNEIFKPHFDARLYSSILYLCVPISGGQTHFPNARLTVNPEVGKLIIWKNDFYYSLHASLPVIEGEKWVLVNWVSRSILDKEI